MASKVLVSLHSLCSLLIVLHFIKHNSQLFVHNICIIPAVEQTGQSSTGTIL